MNNDKTPLGAKPDYILWLIDNKGPDKVEMLKKLDAWPLDLIRPKLEQNPLFKGEDVDACIMHYKRFMSFKGLYPSIRDGMFSARIDAVWHQHILYTKNYAEFCQSVFGYFVHHTPCNIMDLSDEAFAEYGQWLTDYEEVYGPLPDDLAKEVREELERPSPLGDKCAGDHPGHDPDKYKCASH